MKSVQIVLNGISHELEPLATIAQLLERLDLAPIRVAVELNEELVPRKDFDRTGLNPGDRLEVVTFVGGG
jgi:sulfur carrier protein